MASNVMGTNIKLVGEKEYRAALSQIGSALKQLQSELDLSSEKFKDNAKSEKALREQGDILNRQILTQQEKISTLQEVLQKSGETYGESDTRTMKWATTLNKAETELLQMQRALEENRTAYKAAEMEASGYVDKTKTLDAALSELNSGMDVLKSELSLAAEQFRDNAGSVEALTKKNDILERSILTQQEKIEKLKESLQYSAREYGESSEKTNGWKVALNNAEAELSKMQRELDQNTDAIKKMTPPLDKVKKALSETKEQGGGVKTALANLKEEFSLNTDSAKGLGTALTDIAGKFGVQLPDGAAKAAEALNGINAGAALAVTGLGLLAAAIVKVEKQLISMTKESAAYADNILTLSLTTGQTTDQLQEFAYASELIDVSLDTLQGSLTKLTNNMQNAQEKTAKTENVFDKLGVSITTATGELRDAHDVLWDTRRALTGVSDRTERAALEMEIFGTQLKNIDGEDKKFEKILSSMVKAQESTAAATTAFEKLGVSVTDADGHLRSANDVFYDAIDALGDVTNATERDALAMDIFGRSAQDLNPLIVQGADTLREYAQEAHDMGYVLDNDALAALGAVDDAYQRLQKTQEGVKNQLSEQFAPYLTEFYEKITRLIKDGGQALKDSGLVDAFGMILESVGDLIAPTNELAEDSVPKLTQALRPLAEVMAGIADTIDFIRGLVAFNSNPIWSADKWKGLSQMGKAAGFGYSYGNGNHTQTLKEKWMQTDTNYATGANGYGEYFGNGKYYGNRDAYLYALWEEELNSGKPVGSFEAWKMQKGYNASGTDFWRGGRTLIGENGPEEVVLPRGSRILTAQETRQSGGGDTYYVTIEARTVKEFNDIARIARNKRRTDRMGVDKE